MKSLLWAAATILIAGCATERPNFSASDSSVTGTNRTLVLPPGPPGLKARIAPAPSASQPAEQALPKMEAPTVKVIKDVNPAIVATWPKAVGMITLYVTDNLVDYKVAGSLFRDKPGPIELWDYTQRNSRYYALSSQPSTIDNWRNLVRHFSLTSSNNVQLTWDGQSDEYRAYFRPVSSDPITTSKPINIRITQAPWMAMTNLPPGEFWFFVTPRGTNAPSNVVLTQAAP